MSVNLFYSLISIYKKAAEEFNSFAAFHFVTITSLRRRNDCYNLLKV